jgi:DNA modification methylase
MSDPVDNVLYYGDNLDVLRRYVKDESVDLVYLDPPFNSNATYSVLFGHADGTKSAAQIKAFDDTWHWDATAASAFQDAVTGGGEVAKALAAFQTLLGHSTMLAYLSMMAPRLVELRRVLKPTGSLYLHCDPTASHYLKLLLDAVLGAKNFRNEIVWAYKYGGRPKTDFGRKHDTILRYVKTSKWYFNEAAVRIPHEPASIEHNYRHIDEDGRRYREDNWSGKRPYRYYADEGRTRDDIWQDIGSLHHEDKERLGYPTQKPEGLLEVIINASCPPDGTVLDPFCGCGTAIAAAQKLGRRWIGIDLTYLAITLIKSRLTVSGTSDYTVLGEPTTADDAADLASSDPYQFQWWALGLIGARPAEGKKGADRGIDGRLFFFDGDQTPKQVIVSVKAGGVQVGHVRDLRGVLDREQAQIGILISFNEPTQPMRTEAASAGFYSSPWGQHPKIQLFTVAELLAGKRIDMPAGGSQMTQVALPPTPEVTVHPDQLTLGG